MLLRSITKHVRDQNWFAVALDFFIVVVGILIAFQITNWNEGRGDRQRETQILREIATDLRSDVDMYSTSIDSSLSKIAAINYILKKATDAAGNGVTNDVELSGLVYDDYIEANVQLLESSFAERAAAARYELWSVAILVSNSQPSTTAFNSLVSSGELGILHDEALVRRLQEYRFLTAALEKAQDVTFRPGRDNAIDIGQKYGLSAFGKVDENTLLELVSTNPQLAATLQTQLGWAKGHFVILSAAKNSASVLLNQIEGELGMGALQFSASQKRP